MSIAAAPSIPFLDLGRACAPLREEISAAILRVVDAQGFILGPEVSAFEQESAQLLGAAHAVGCASGSDALLLALMALDLAPGDEVITSPYTFFATAGAIVRLGLRPVFCDIDPASFNIDPIKLSEKLTSRTRVIIPVHLYGRCAAMPEVMKIALRANATVIEDAAQAFAAEAPCESPVFVESGAFPPPQFAGTIGHIGCFSFFPSKNLGAFGDAGLLTTNDAELAESLRSLRTHGARERYLHTEVGINSRLDALQAAILRVKLPHVLAWTKSRQALAAGYTRLFGEAGLISEEKTNPSPGKIVVPEVVPGHAFNQFVIRIEALRRDLVRAALSAAGIGTAIYYPMPLHMQPCFASLGHHPGDFPEAERASHETLALPIFPGLTSGEQSRVVSVISTALASAV